MKENVGERLPNPTMQKGARNKAEKKRQLPRNGGKCQLDKEQRKEGEKVEKHQASGGAVEVGKGKRAATNSRHRSREQGKPWSRWMSWGWPR